MRLYIMRHGDARIQPQGVTQGRERELTELGKQECAHTANWLAKEESDWSLVLHSPVLRAEQSKDIVLQSISLVQVESCPALRPDYDPNMVVDVLKKHQHLESILLVSHMPLVVQLAGTLVSGHHVPFAVATASVMVIDIEDFAPGGQQWVRHYEPRL